MMYMKEVKIFSAKGFLQFFLSYAFTLYPAVGYESSVATKGIWEQARGNNDELGNSNFSVLLRT